ncbi:MAG: hypothetical protein BroJett018_06990 [Chloroflexota bacterium]|nr:hypothetical protein [Chloroflexota bacterium]NOG63093.1 hypothetical protein [Chloroflexota bacterium]GIK62905.1 MAG: hypothetical protein BroJett018_06990 [Chloroflexota bacterium]
MTTEIPATEKKERVYRPLGLTIGLLSIIPLFGIEPIIWLYIAHRLNVDANGIISGGLALDFWRWAGGIAGGIVLITAIMAWIGKPRSSQYLVQASVIASFLLIMVAAWVRAFGDCTGCLMDGATQTFNDIFQCKIPIQIIAFVYFIFYINRAPARAFYTQVPLPPWNPDEE